MGTVNAKKEYLTNEFYEAMLYEEHSRHLLNEKQQFFADELIKNGNEVRFNDVRILYKKSGARIALSIMRHNLE